MANKQPYLKFYPGDWLKDSDVRRCSIFARGLLVDLLCLCHEAKFRGRLCEADGVTPWSNDDIVNALGGASRDELLEGISELERKGVLSRDERGVLYSRRMVRDAEISEERAAAGSAGGVAKSKQSSSKTVANGLANTCQNPEYEYEYEPDIESSPKEEELVLDAWNEVEGNVKVKKLTDARRRSLLQRIRDPSWDWRAALAKFPLRMTSSDPNGWKPDFDWFVKPDSVTKILEGKYDWEKNDGKPKSKIGPGQRHTPDAEFGAGFNLANP